MSITTAAPLTEQQVAKLAALQNYGTRYEVVLAKPSGQEVRLCYTGRKSTVGLDHAVSPHAKAIVAWLGIDGGSARISRHKGALQITGGGVVKFSGRTQREAITAGELPWIGSIKQEVAA